MFRNICLIGMPYSGKSFLSRLLYKSLQKGHIDTDDLIRSRYNCNLDELIKKVGNDTFLTIENKIIKNIVCKNTIIATGGSVIYNHSSMDYLKNDLDSEIYHLYISYPEFLRRMKNIESRGVIMNKKYSYKDLYDERIELYNLYADHTINVDSLFRRTS